jgi:hypothetical protein
MNTQFLIYLLGFIISYFLVRNFFRKLAERKYAEEYGWYNVFINIAISSLSYISVMIFLFIFIISKFPNKPPKFL